MKGSSLASLASLAALAALLFSAVVSIALAGPNTPLPSSTLIVAYVTSCDEENVLAAVGNGTNVLIWFAANLNGADAASGKPLVQFGKNVTCIASVAKALRDRGHNNVSHLVSVGGWDAPHPNTSFTPAQWHDAWLNWNADNAKIGEPFGWAGFDGVGEVLVWRRGRGRVGALVLIGESTRAEEGTRAKETERERKRQLTLHPRQQTGTSRATTPLRRPTTSSQRRAST